MKQIVIIAAALALTACAHRPQPPIVDTKGQSPEKLASFAQDEKECRVIQVKAMPTSLFEALATPDVHKYNKDREEKAATIMRACLTGRGHAVLY